MSYNSIVAAQPSGVIQQQETGAVTPRARPMSRLAVVRYLLVTAALLNSYPVVQCQPFVTDLIIHLRFVSRAMLEIC